MTRVRPEPAPVSSRGGRLFLEPEAAFRVVHGTGRVAPEVDIGFTSVTESNRPAVVMSGAILAGRCRQ
jgi:hypothetical protein